MDREIKFRAWDKVTEKMYFFGLCEDWGKSGEKSRIIDISMKIMQFTGLKDKNCKEIYEGDLVRTPEWNKLRVQWDYDQWGLFDGICNEASIDENVEVIGNIYEN